MKTDEYKDLLEQITSRYELPEKYNAESITAFVSKMGSLQSIFGLCNKDVSKTDLGEVDEDSFARLAFNEYTIFPRNLKIDYKKILSDSKYPGLGISALHKQSIKGDGINVAIIDKPILRSHTELAGRIKEYNFICPESEFNDKMHFHGITCAAFLCGSTCGVATRANLYYYAYPDYFESDGMYWNYHFGALDMILEHNRTAQKQDIIKIISVSAGFPHGRDDLRGKMDDYTAKLKVYGCYLIFSNNFGKTFTCSSKTKTGGIDNADKRIVSDDPDTYRLGFWQENDYHRKRILIPAGGRTSPCNSGDDRYMYNGNQSCNSWAIPYLCGVLAMAMQVKSHIGYDDFCDIAKRTALVNGEGLFVLNPRGIVRECARG